ncbi:MAG: PilX N-terminal domain-containing pilus assembly protein [Motiliproteus sp.]|nr:PilX N-terminal domain-containing pilus assembly protein [Motiliproteus sp.]MCW9051525.1 PilX N-terminal domain-containing pilus assembly protein [Motiliproteus sp.]
MNPIKQSDLPNKQRGVVLIACLLVIVVVTMIAATASKTSSFEEKMAANAQTYNRTFQAAESAVEYGFDVEALMFEATDASDGYSSVDNVTVGTSGVTATAQTRFLGEGIAPGNSLGTASTYRYEVHGTGEMTDLNSSTLIRQGFYRVSFVTSTDQ